MRYFTDYGNDAQPENPPAKILTRLRFFHLFAEALLQRQIALQFGHSTVGRHAAELLVLLVEQATFGHQPFAGVRVGRELPCRQFVLGLWIDLLLIKCPNHTSIQSSHLRGGRVWFGVRCAASAAAD